MVFIFKKIHITTFIVSLAVSVFSFNILAATSSQFATVPPATTNSPSAKPIVMLATGNDHQLFYKAYNDWSDLDDDGDLDTTYTDTFDYYGYFDYSKCYKFDPGTDNRFESSSTFATGTNKHQCNSNVSYRWSGNFLNWVSMSRMDIMRKVLFGGKRDSGASGSGDDDADETTLVRAYIPNDNHAWSKFFPATDLDKYTPYNPATYTNGVTFCNVTPYDGTNEYSEDTTSTPRLRVADGNWNLWAAQESAQCMIDGEAPQNRTTAESPAALIDEHVVRVQVCEDDRIGKENCHSYDGGTNYKPVGLLNRYGETNLMDFGLITGSYQKGKDGGILRKNISPMGDEVNSDGTWNSSTNGIIATMNKLRISRYSYSDNGYGAGSVDNCPYGQNTWANGECANWGNPMGEIYLEALRYFSGANNGVTAFQANSDTTWIPGIARNVAWRDPYGSAATNPAGGGYPSCSKPNIINFSTGIFGFDHDNYGGASDVGGTLDVDAETDTVGDSELDAAKKYYVGSLTGGTAGDECSAQTVADLSDVTGLCPEAAGLQGSFKIAGLAYYGHNNDLRPALTGAQKVNTFSVSLAPPIPDIKVDVGGKTVRIIPAGYNYRDNNAMVLVNFQVISQTATSGEFFMNYENAPAGADHDSDFKGYLRYNVVGNEISITGYATGESAGSTMHLGYVIDGVTDPGIHYVASNTDVTRTDNTNGGGNSNTTQANIDTVCGAVAYPASGSYTRCTVDDAYAVTAAVSATTHDARGVRTHTAGTSTSELLKSPLWYAAKWGGFTDIDNDGKPLKTFEYDSVNNATGVPGSDGVPDNYFVSQDPSKIEQQLNQVLSQISNRRSAGSAAAVITNTVTSTAMIVQGLYQPEVKSIDQTQTIQWAGYLHTLLLDKEGNFREDSNQNGTLDGYATDKVIKFFYDTTQNRTRVTRYATSDGKTLVEESVGDIDTIKYLWDAKRELNEMSSSALTTNRTYTDANNLSTNTNSKRYIFTWLDDDDDGVVDANEQTDFEASDFASNESNFGYFHLQVDKDGDADIDADDAGVLVNFIRGIDDTSNANLRSRTIDYDNDSTDEVWRLGDVINSSPAIVERPSSSWRTQYGDTTYDAYTAQYKNRRNMVYVGANDGLLHAFNSGFINTATQSYALTRAAAAHESGVPASHKLGAEVWAYAPKNLLPHMQWLSEVGYPNHVSYVDGELKAFDVNIFPTTGDSDHPNGWGTILVATMRFGGGSDDATNPTSLSIDVDGDGNENFKSRSSIIIMDITNPEKPPVLLAEFNDPNLGLTTSTPQLMVFRQPKLSDGDWSDPSVNDWYLVFGSGPTDIQTLTSSQTAASTATSPALYTLKLNNIDSSVITVNKKSIGANSYIGRPHTVHWGNEFITDSVYFGVAGGTVAVPNGYLARMTSSLLRSDTSFYDIAGNWAISTVINPSQPFVFKPTTLSVSGNKWVHAGTGRRFVVADDLMTPKQSYYGIKENISSTNGLPTATTFTRGTPSSTLSNGELQAVTGVQMFTNYTFLDPLNNIPNSITGYFSSLETYMNSSSVSGWYKDLSTVSSLQERINADTQTLTQQLITTSFLPSTDSCNASGRTFFCNTYNVTGTVHPGAGIGENESITNSGANMVTECSSYSGENFANLVCIGSKCGLVIQGSGGDGGNDSDGDGINDEDEPTPPPPPPPCDPSDPSCTPPPPPPECDENTPGSTTTDGGLTWTCVKDTPSKEGRQSWREIYIEEEF